MFAVPRRLDPTVVFIGTMRCAFIRSPPTLDRVPDKNRATGGPQRYEIRVRGPIGPTIMQAFPTLTASRSGHDTLLAGSLPDQSALYGVIHQLEALGLDLLEIRCPSSSGAATASEIT
jgi:hypothetical protein